MGMIEKSIDINAHIENINYRIENENGNII